MSKERIRISDPKRAKRYAEFLNTALIGDLSELTALTEVLIEEAINENNQSAAVAFIKLHCMLADSHNKHMRRQGELLSRDTLIGIIHSVLNSIQRHFIAVPDFNARMMAVLKEIEPLLLDAKDLDPDLEAIDVEVEVSEE